MADFPANMEETCAALKELKEEDAQVVLGDVLRDEVNFSTAQRSYIATMITSRLPGVIERENALLREQALESDANGEAVRAQSPRVSCGKCTIEAKYTFPDADVCYFLYHAARCLGGQQRQRDPGISRANFDCTRQRFV